MRHVITALCLLGALGAYVGGWSQGIAPLVILGLVLEIVFWVRLIPAWRGTHTG